MLNHADAPKLAPLVAKQPANNFSHRLPPGIRSTPGRQAGGRPFSCRRDRRPRHRARSNNHGLHLPCASPRYLALAEAQLTEAQREYDRNKDGPDPDVVTLAEAQLKNAQAQIELAHQEQVYIDLIAPIGGTILSIDASIGESISTNAIVTLADLSQPLLEIYLDETVIRSLSAR